MKNNKLTKQEFCAIIDRLKCVSDAQEAVGKIVRNINRDGFDDCSGLNIIHQDIVIDLLAKIMNADIKNKITDNDISYFIYELNFGRDYKSGMIKDENGNDIDFSSAEKLYDYLISTFMEKK